MTGMLPIFGSARSCSRNSMPFISRHHHVQQDKIGRGSAHCFQASRPLAAQTASKPSCFRSFCNGLTDDGHVIDNHHGRHKHGTLLHFQSNQADA